MPTPTQNSFSPSSSASPSSMPSHPDRNQPLFSPSAISSSPFPPSTSSQPQDDQIPLLIKCPSLDKESSLITFHPETTIAEVKIIIQNSWPGKPKAQGMRCIKAGRLLTDGEKVKEIVGDAQITQPSSLHLVIHPDAWSEPHNRSTPSRSRPHPRPFAAAPAVGIPAASVLTAGLDGNPVASCQNHVSSATASNFAPHRNPSPLPDSPPIFSHNVLNPSLPSPTSSTPTMDLNTPSLSEISPRLEEVLRATAPANYSILLEAVAAAYDVYLSQYEYIYRILEYYQAGPDDDEAFRLPSPPSRDILDSVEEALMGWDPIPLSSLVPSSRFSSSSSPHNCTRHFYSQVNYDGLPYLLCLPASAADQSRAEALAELLSRMNRLRLTMRRIENLDSLHRAIQSSVSPLTQRVVADVATSSSNDDRPRGMPIHTYRAVVGTINQLTWSEVIQIWISMALNTVKLGFMIYMFSRRSSPFKRWSMLIAAFAYIQYEAWKLAHRLVAARQPPPTNPTPPTNPNNDNNQQNANPNQNGPHDAAPQAADQQHLPTGANVPNSDSLERQIQENPHLPLPAPAAPVRHRNNPPSSPLSLDYWLDSLAYFSMDSEDEQLGLLSPSSSSSRSSNNNMHNSQQRRQSNLYHYTIVPVVLFFATLVPEIEIRRRKAIEDRERVIRNAVRLEQMRKDRLHQLASDSNPDSETTSSKSQIRSEYSERILRRRRRTEGQLPDEIDGFEQVQQQQDDVAFF